MSEDLVFEDSHPFGTSSEPVEEQPIDSFGEQEQQEPVEQSYEPEHVQHSFESSNTFSGGFSDFADTPLRKEQDERMQDKADERERKRQEIIVQASEQVRTFYQKRTDTLQKNQATNRAGEKKFVEERDAVLGGAFSKNEWERVGTLIDFKFHSGGKDVSRMRKILLDMKH